MGGGGFQSVSLSCGYGVKFRFLCAEHFFSCAKTWFLIWDIWKIRYAFFEVHRSRFFSMCTISEILHTTSLAETWVPLKETWVPLEETRFHLEETWVPFKETWVPLEETRFHLKETWVPLKETWVHACTQAAVFRAPNLRWSRRHWFSSKNCWF